MVVQERCCLNFENPAFADDRCQVNVQHLEGNGLLEILLLQQPGLQAEQFLEIFHLGSARQPGEKVGVENVRRATRAAMLAAARNGFDVVAIPGMGTGLGGVDPADAARALVDELRAHRQPKPTTVYLVDIDDEILMCLEEALRLAVG